MASIAESLARLDRWAADAGVTVGPTRPTAPADAAQWFRAATGVRPPDDLVALWAATGPRDEWLGDRLLSVERAIAAKQSWDDIIARSDDPDDDYHSAMASADPDKVAPLYWSPAWVPFTEDSGGNGLALDTAPLPGGTAGQVVTYGPDRDTVAVLAPSLADLVADVAARAEAGGLVVVDGRAMLDDGYGPNGVIEALYGLRLAEDIDDDFDDLDDGDD